MLKRLQDFAAALDAALAKQLPTCSQAVAKWVSAVFSGSAHQLIAGAKAGTTTSGVTAAAPSTIASALSGDSSPQDRCRALDALLAGATDTSTDAAAAAAALSSTFIQAALLKCLGDSEAAVVRRAAKLCATVLEQRAAAAADADADASSTSPPPPAEGDELCSKLVAAAARFATAGRTFREAAGAVTACLGALAAGPLLRLWPHLIHRVARTLVAHLPFASLTLSSAEGSKGAKAKANKMGKDALALCAKLGASGMFPLFAPPTAAAAPGTNANANASAAAAAFVRTCATNALTHPDVCLAALDSLSASTSSSSSSSSAIADAEDASTWFVAAVGAQACLLADSAASSRRAQQQRGPRTSRRRTASHDSDSEVAIAASSPAVVSVAMWTLRATRALLQATRLVGVGVGVGGATPPPEWTALSVATLVASPAARTTFLAGAVHAALSVVPATPDRVADALVTDVRGGGVGGGGGRGAGLGGAGIGAGGGAGWMDDAHAGGVVARSLLTLLAKVEPPAWPTFEPTVAFVLSRHLATRSLRAMAHLAAATGFVSMRVQLRAVCALAALFAAVPGSPVAALVVVTPALLVACCSPSASVRRVAVRAVKSVLEAAGATPTAIAASAPLSLLAEVNAAAVTVLQDSAGASVRRAVASVLQGAQPVAGVALALLLRDANPQVMDLGLASAVVRLFFVLCARVLCCGRLRVGVG